MSSLWKLLVVVDNSVVQNTFRRNILVVFPVVWSPTLEILYNMLFFYRGYLRAVNTSNRVKPAFIRCWFLCWCKIRLWRSTQRLEWVDLLFKRFEILLKSQWSRLGSWIGPRFIISCHTSLWSRLTLCRFVELFCRQWLVLKSEFKLSINQEFSHLSPG